MNRVTRAVMEWPDAPQVARELRRKRIEKNMPQIVLADKIGYSRIMVGFWERGVYKPSPFALQCWKDGLT